MRIGELGERAQVPPKTLRYYEQIGLLPMPPRTPGGYRDYDDTAVDRLSFIKAAQSIGLTLGEIREILAFRDRGEIPCGHVVALIEARARDLSRHILALQRMRADLRRLAEEARRLPATLPGTFCHIIESLGPVKGRGRVSLPPIGSRDPEDAS